MNKLRPLPLLSAFFISWILFFIHSTAQPSQTSSSSTDSTGGYEQQIRQLVDFIEYTFNTLGDTAVSVKEKDIIINSSYLKIFRDDKVQIEDDLDENRIIVTNKNVQAYLKDINFFYKWVKFEFTIEDISSEINETGQRYLKVTLNRNLQGKTLDDSLVNNNRIRYMEINLNEDQKELKVVSIYTTKLSEEGDMISWWIQLTSDWKDFFLTQLERSDSSQVSDYRSEMVTYLSKMDSISAGQDSATGPPVLPTPLIRKLWAFEEVDLAGNRNITDLQPLKKLTRLKVLDISGTLIGDLAPLRSLASMEKFDCSGSPVKDLTPLRYSLGMKELLINNTLVDQIGLVTSFHHLEVLAFSNTRVQTLESVSSLPGLMELRCAQTPVDSLTPIRLLENLTVLDISNTRVVSLAPLQELQKLTYLNIGNTGIDNLDPLKNMTGLQYLYMDYTLVRSLDPLEKLPFLKRIYCDKSLITRDEAGSFLLKKPGTLVIYETEELTGWWNGMDPVWQNVFIVVSGFEQITTSEQLHEIILIQKIDLHNLKTITDLAPLSRLINLHELDVSNTSIESLEPLRNSIHLKKLEASATHVSNLIPVMNLTALTWLDISETPVNVLEPVSYCTQLEYLNIRNTPVSEIFMLAELPGLTRIDADGSMLDREAVIRFKDINDRCQVIFQTKALEEWWTGLDEAWKEVFRSAVDLPDPLTEEQLHRLVDIRELTVSGNSSIVNLEPLKQLVRLTSLEVTGTRVSDLSPLQTLQRLERLIFTESPVTTIAPLTTLKGLKTLDLSNTQVIDHELLQGMTSLEYLNISGTPVKNLKWTVTLQNLIQLDIYNTSVSSLSELEVLDHLKTIKCYNSKLNEKKIQKFKLLRPDVEIIFY